MKPIAVQITEVYQYAKANDCPVIVEMIEDAANQHPRPPLQAGSWGNETVDRLNP